MSKLPVFSVVTVCFNAGNLIRKTIESVLAQDFYVSSSDVGFEYVIQDGASKDNTLEIVNEYKDRFEAKGIKLIINSEKDGGIYDAMNKGVKASSGEYVIFMNADDCFYSESVLSDVFASLNIENSDDLSETADSYDTSKLPDIIYGDCVVKELGMYFMFRKCFDLIKERMPFSHQACIAKRELLLENPLKPEYRITADYCFILGSYLSGKSFHDSNVIIALVTADGLSSLHMFDTFVEVNSVCRQLGVPRFDESGYNNKLKEMKLKQFVLSHFPKFIVKAIRKKQISGRGQSINASDLNIPSWAK